MSIAASKLQQRRRDQESLLHETESFLSQHQNTQRIHDWENRTNQQIKQREVANLTQKLLQDDEDQLRERQKELQSLYSNEMEQWKDTLRSSMEVSQEERMEQIRRRAYELKAKREEERQKFVKECYQRQWVNACDDLRAVDSKNTLDRLMEDRKLMIQNKAANQNHRNESKHGRGISDESNPPVNQQMVLMEKRENDERELRLKANLETKQALDRQMEWKRNQSAAMAAQIQQDEQEQLRRLAMLEQKSRDLEIQSLQKAKKEGDEMWKETMNRAEEREAQHQLERSRDLILLQHALNLERDQINAERAKKNEGKEAASEFVDCLREQAQRQEKENLRVNAIRDEEFQKLQKRNEDKAMAEREARRKWMEEVHASRQEQIRQKERDAEEARRELEMEFQQTKEKLRLQQESERRDLEQAKAERMETVMANKATIEKRAKEREREQHEKYILNKQIRFAEAVHQKKMEEHINGYRR